MKKLLVITVLFVMLAVFATTVVNATTGSELPEIIYEKGKKYGVNESHKVKMERYIAKHPATDEQANQVVAKVDEVVAILENAGVTDPADLSSEDFKKFQTLVTDAATILDVKLVWKSSRVEIMYNGEVEDVIYFSKKLPYTGSEVDGGNIALIVSSVAVVALAAGILLRKKSVNA